MASDSTAATGSGRLPADERRATLVQAGWTLLKRGGPKLVTIDNVVAEVGLTRPIFYRHFSDRSDLLAALYEDYADDLVARSTAAIGTAGDDPIAALRAGLNAYFDLISERGPWLRQLIYEASDTPGLEAARMRLRERQLVVWSGNVKRIENHPKTVTLLRLSQALSMDAATLWLGGDAERDDLIDLIVSMVEGAIAALQDDAIATRT